MNVLERVVIRRRCKPKRPQRYFVSVCASTYAKIAAFATANGVSVAATVDAVIATYLEGQS